MHRPDAIPAYPLSWPSGYPRTAHRKAGNQFVVADHSREYRSTKKITFDVARRKLREELARLKATDVRLSTNVKLRADGEASADAADRKLTDPGVAIYFTLKGRQMVMAQDAYLEVASNVRSLGLAIEAMRSLERHGGGVMMERAFDGFLALPGPAGSTSAPKRAWWVVLNYSEHPEDRADLSVEEVKARFNTLAKRRHPDAPGGSAEAMGELLIARDDAIRAIGG